MPPPDFEEIERRTDAEIDNLLIFSESITALSVEYAYGTPAIYWPENNGFRSQCFSPKMNGFDPAKS